MKSIFYTLLFWLLSFSTVFGQINVPSEVTVGEPIVATVNMNMPEGASFTGGWKLPENVGTYKFNDFTVGLWPAKAGKYELKFSGFWIHLKEVTFTDGEGNVITIMSYLGHGFIDETATFELKGSGPDPPDPPDPPPGQKQLMIFYDADQLDDYAESQRQILTSRLFRKTLEDNGHLLLSILESAVFTQSDLSVETKKWVNAAKDISLPSVAYAPRTGGKITVVKLPNNTTDLLNMLNGGT